MNWIDKYNRIIWDRIANSVQIDEKSLGILRWVYGFYALLFNAPTFSWLSDVPQGYFDPQIISISYLFNGFPHPALFEIINFICLILILFITVGYKTRIATLSLFIIKIFALSFVYSFGKIDHDIIENLLLVCMFIAGWGKHYALVPDKPKNYESADKGLALYALFLTFGFFSAGALKVIIWIDFNLSTSGFLTWYYLGFLNLGRDQLLAPYVHGMPNIVYEMADYTAALFEVTGFFFLVKSRKYWLSWLFIASSFHLANTMIINIPFYIHTIVYITFLDLTVFKKFIPRINIRLLAVISIFMTLGHILQRIIDSEARILFNSDYYAHISLNLYTGVLLWSLTIMTFLAYFLTDFRKDSEA